MAMSTLTPIAVTMKTGPRTCGETVRAIEKSSPSARPNGERHDTPRDPSKQPPRLQIELVSQAETARHDPFWDGPRLTPAFVTHVLGQVMVGERNRIVRGAYGAAETNAPRLLDTRL